MSEIRHGGLIALYDRGGWRGVLIEGPSGAGKSDLALRALTAGLRLVADDRTLVWPCEGRLFGACPPSIAGLIEARGLGVLAQSARTFVEIHLIVRCARPDEAVERLPEFASQAILGIDLPTLDLHALESSSHLKLIHALSLLGGWR
jgi:serine kinase of HPr protein (carbohydrate metabolism regulator)